MSNWPVSRRLFTVIVAALLMGVIFGGLRVVDAEGSAQQFGRTEQLASLSTQLTTLVNDLQNQRDRALPTFNAVAFDAVFNAGQKPTDQLVPLYQQTETDAVPVRHALSAVVAGRFPANIQVQAAAVSVVVSQASLGYLEGLLTNSTDTTVTFAGYQSDIAAILSLQAQVAQGVTDATLTSQVQALSGLALAKEQASQLRGLLDEGLTPTKGTDAQWSLDLATETKLNLAFQSELVNLGAFHAAATPAENAVFADRFGPASHLKYEALTDSLLADIIADASGNVVSVVPSNATAKPTPAQQVQQARQLAREQASIIGPNGIMMLPVVRVELATKGIGTLAQARTLWNSGLTDQISAMQSAENAVGADLSARAGQLHQSAQRSAIAFGVITLAVLLIVLLAALAVARSLVRPLRRLREGALNIASVQLPERVKMLSDSPESAASMEVAPINVVSEDEIGQVARAFDQVHSEAVRLAGEQALLRSSFNAMFVNLSRRSQSLIERLARTIDTLEQTEDDPDRLGSLFAMDHMVTRMRRNSENLLLLAGHENPRKWSDSIPLADVARAATSEIEQYNRVTLNIPPGIAVIGQAVSDVVHLIAELVENATIFSPKDTQVLLTMQELTSGGVLIEILDKGIGVSEARLTDMNFRLDNPPTIDVSVSRHMGLFAVARLAERHRVRVRLRPAAPQGLSALVWLPDSVIERTGRYSSVQSWSTQSGASPTIAGGRPGGASGSGADMALEEGNAALAPSGYAGAGASGGYGGNGNNYGGGGNNYGGNGGGGNGTNYGSGGNGNGGNGSGHAGNGNGGNGNGYSASGGNGVTVPASRETRTASGWFRGPVAGAPAPAARAGGSPVGAGPVPFAAAGAGAAPDWSVRRVPGESLAGSPFADQASAGPAPVSQTSAAGLPVRSPRGNGPTPAAAPPGALAASSQPSPAGLAGTGAQALPTRGSDPGRPNPSRGPVPRGPGGGSHALPQRSPDQARSRLAAFQRGNRRAEEEPGQTGQFGQVPGAGEGSER